MKKRKEELLEMAWMAKESGKFSREDVLNSPDKNITVESLDALIQEGYLMERAGSINFTPRGEEAARRVIRAHRLSERLFTDVLDLPLRSMEANACTFEHFLSPEVIDSICTLLGHPKECPHGHPIPPAHCCETARTELKPLIIPLGELKSGSDAKVVYVVTKHHQRLDQLTAFGIVPGVLVRVHQTTPAYVVKVGETDLALDRDIVQDIYVRPMKGVGD